MVELRLRPLPDPIAELTEQRTKDLNFNLQELGANGGGWAIDDYSQRLPQESPGPPEPSGSWETARAISAKYAFVDNRAVEAFYDEDEPLQERTMLLRLSFAGFYIYVGVRVGEVYEETRSFKGRQARVWGWNYRTLEGHVEMGQIDFQVWKWIESGEVEFRIRAVSKPAPVRSVLVRAGLAVFGRPLQVRFAKRACARMATLTEAARRDS